jgi:hypothetical protein
MGRHPLRPSVVVGDRSGGEIPNRILGADGLRNDGLGPLGFARPDTAEHQNAHPVTQVTFSPRLTRGRGARIRRSWEARLAA